jgi:hypothetical protein
MVKLKHKKKKTQIPKRPTTVLILGWLLILQSAILFGLGLFHFNLNEGPQLFSSWFSQLWYGAPSISGPPMSFRIFLNELINNATSQHLLSALIESAALFFLTILALSAAYGFFRLWRIAWGQAVFVQGACLLIALILYFLGKPYHIYIVMIYSIFMVLYLNYANIQEVFHERLPIIDAELE